MSGLPSGRSQLRRGLLLLILMLLLAALGLCWFTGDRYERSRAPQAPELPVTVEEDFPLLTLTRADHETGEEGAVSLNLSSYEGECLISDGGVYRLSGNLKGVIRVAAEEQTVRLILDSVTVTSPEGPALLAESAGKLILTLPEGSASAFSDSGRFSAASGEEACISCHAPLTINGTGSLTVNGLYKDAIRSRDIVRVPGGQITVTCKRTGIHGSDGIVIEGGALNISSEKYGMRTTKSGAGGRGNLIITGGDHQIIAGRHAFLVSRGDLYISGCRIQDKSVVSTADVGGKTFIQSGCIQ